jgi:hypothetical protein
MVSHAKKPTTRLSPVLVRGVLSHRFMVWMRGIIGHALAGDLGESQELVSPMGTSLLHILQVVDEVPPFHEMLTDIENRRASNHHVNLRI